MCDRLLSAVSKMVFSESIKGKGELKVHYNGQINEMFIRVIIITKQIVVNGVGSDCS